MPKGPPGPDAHITTRGGHRCGRRGPLTAGPLPALVMEKVEKEEEGEESKIK